jgi:hypothetical protein
VKTASVLYEDHGNMFFTGVGIGAEKLLNEVGFVVHDTHKHAPNAAVSHYCVRFNVNVRIRIAEITIVTP